MAEGKTDKRRIALMTGITGQVSQFENILSYFFFSVRALETRTDSEHGAGWLSDSSQRFVSAIAVIFPSTWNIRPQLLVFFGIF